ncbi:MAG: zinc transporter ZntB [Lysobacterales bacterium]|jgi:zinc transporter
MSQEATPPPPISINAFVLDGTGGAQKLPVEEADRARHSSKPVWMRVNFGDTRGRKWLMDDSGLDETVVDAILQEESRPRTLVFGKGVLIVLRGVNLNPGADAEDMISVRTWLEPGRIITASRRRLRSLDDIEGLFEQKHGPDSPQSMLIELIDRLADYIADVIDKLEGEIEEAESSISDPDIIIHNSPFSLSRRRSARLRRYMAPQREALDRVSRLTNDWFSAEQLAEVREQENRFTLMIEDLDLVRERALVAQEEFLGIVAHQQNTRMLVLSIIAAVFLPLSFLTGLMGMNVAGLPGTENPLSFWWLVLGMIGTAGAILVLFHFKRWL